MYIYVYMCVYSFCDTWFKVIHGLSDNISFKVLTLDVDIFPLGLQTAEYPSSEFTWNWRVFLHFSFGHGFNCLR